MAKNLHLPIRMCVSCRDRHTQNNLYRLQCIEGNVEIFNKNGRSFYLCKECLYQEKKVLKALMRQCRGGNKDKFMNRIKEIITDGRKS